MLGERKCGIGDQYAAQGSGQQSGRGVDGVAGNRVGGSCGVAEIARHDRPRVDADMQRDGLAELARPVGAQLNRAGLHVEGGTKRAFGVVLVRYGRTEHRQYGITHELFRLRQCRKQRVLEGAHLLRIEALRKRGETRNVGEQHRYLPAIGVPWWIVPRHRGAGHDTCGAAGQPWRRCHRGLGWRRLGGCGPRPTAAGTESKVRFAGRTTPSTGRGLPVPATRAKGKTCRHLRTAPCTRHRLSPASPFCTSIACAPPGRRAYPLANVIADPLFA